MYFSEASDFISEIACNQVSWAKIPLGLNSAQFVIANILICFEKVPEVPSSFVILGIELLL